MLKWAFTEPRQSYLPNSSDHTRAASLNELHQMPVAAFYAQAAITPKSSLSRWQTAKSNITQPCKENQITSTPLLGCLSPASRQLSKDELYLRKLGSLKDLSNIYPETASVTPKRATPKRTPPKRHNQRFASTLPTLDANEYSPSSALIPGPLLALRGIGIPDAYFEKPRYLESTKTPSQKTDKSDTKSCSNEASNTTTAAKLVSHEAESSSFARSLNSAQMDDSTLERMIDAIIASSHKETKAQTKLSRQSQTHARRTNMMSPTYTPAYDPANDLDEIWWSAEQRYRQSNKKTCHHQCAEQQLLCTPKSHKSQQLESSFKRRRQRPVRRKRKLKSFRNKVQKSARKLLRVGSNVSVVMPQLNEIDEGSSSSEQIRVNLSPDSGHNSSSGDSTKTEDHTVHHHKPNEPHAISEEVEVTKRQLSFAMNPL